MEQFIQDITREAGQAILPMFLKSQEITLKNGQFHEHNFVTEADLKAQDILVNAVRKKFPDHGIVSEEISEEKWETDKEYIWIFDPLDGTKMFETRWALFGVMAALQHKGEIELGAIYFPVTDELLFAKRGGGVWLNGEEIACSDRNHLERSFGMTTCGYASSLSESERVRQQSIMAEHYVKKTFFFNSFWAICPGIKALAQGKIDWMAITGEYWDFAPAKVILEESGCVVTDALGEPFNPSQPKDLLAANPAIHNELVKLLGLDKKA